jgi:hypothetical protein
MGESGNGVQKGERCMSHTLAVGGVRVGCSGQRGAEAQQVREEEGWVAVHGRLWMRLERD